VHAVAEDVVAAVDPVQLAADAAAALAAGSRLPTVPRTLEDVRAARSRGRRRRRRWGSDRDDQRRGGDCSSGLDELHRELATGGADDAVAVRGELEGRLEQAAALELGECAVDLLGVEAELGAHVLDRGPAVATAPDPSRARAQAVAAGVGLVIDEQLIAELLDDQILRPSNRPMGQFHERSLEMAAA